MNRFESLKRIVSECQAGKVDGVTIDLFTASACVAVAEALNETNRAKFLELPIPKMVSVAFKLTK